MSLNMSCKDAVSDMLRNCWEDFKAREFETVLGIKIHNKLNF